MIKIAYKSGKNQIYSIPRFFIVLKEEKKEIKIYQVKAIFFI